MTSRRLFKYFKVPELLKIGMLVWGEADSETFAKKGVYEESFSDMLHGSGGSYSSSCILTLVLTSKDNEVQAGVTSFKTSENSEEFSALEVLLENFLSVYLYLIGTFTSLIHIESCKSPTAVLFDDDMGRISIRYYETKEYHSECSGKISRIMHRTLVTTCKLNGVHQVYFDFVS
ncbi:hypothetical protein Tco_0911602 [Tanacetum coccineum]|uniref:Uncharacterized protein n=1 Tax=Tanacetum coccineum TaxID=301880 RepID=A0ABQ5CXW1_9ASTR